MSVDPATVSKSVQDIVKAILVKEKFQDPKVTFHKGSGDGDGLIGVNIAVEIAEGSRLLNLFVKTVKENQDPKIRRNFCVRTGFSNEIQFYDSIHPALADFYQRKTGKEFNMVPKFYGSNDEEFKEVLVLENLKLQDYTMFDNKKFLGKEEVELAMKEYGKFHAVSFVMKEEEPEVFAEVTKGIPEFMLEAIDTWNLVQVAENWHRVLEKYWKSPEDDLLLQKLKPIPKKLEEAIPKYTNYQGPYKVLTHGDSRNNNIMYRKKDDQYNFRLIDFQGIKVTCFLADICYFIYTSALSEENAALLDTFMDIYYKSLCENIKELGGDPDKLCPRHAIEENWELFSMFALIIGYLTLPVMVGLPSVSANPDVVLMVLPNTPEQVIEKEKEFSKMMRPYLQHFVDKGLV